MRNCARKVTVGIVLFCYGLHLCMSSAASSSDDNAQIEQVRFHMSDIEMLPKSSNVGQSEALPQSSLAKDSQDNQYCFQFTWPGTGFDNTTDLCKDAKKSKNPCFLPYVIANETNAAPDIDALDVYCDGGNNCKVYCKLASGKNCIRYAYYRDGLMFNATYFCGIVSETSNSGAGTTALKTGCDSQKTGSFTVEACYCQTNKCNKYQN